MAFRAYAQRTIALHFSVGLGHSRRISPDVFDRLCAAVCDVWIEVVLGFLVLLARKATLLLHILASHIPSGIYPQQHNHPLFLAGVIFHRWRG